MARPAKGDVGRALNVLHNPLIYAGVRTTGPVHAACLAAPLAWLLCLESLVTGVLLTVSQERGN